MEGGEVGILREGWRDDSTHYLLLRVECSLSLDIDRADILNIVGIWCLGNSILEGRFGFELVLFGV